ncbi:MAG: hypothetical protein AB2L18_09350 [Anaerolineaceae bacterium]
MTYPLSSTISPGDPTLASQYNNLRSDALLLGQSPADAVSIGQLLERYESRLTLQKLNTAQVVVPASSTNPVSLFIGGFLVQATANVNLDSSSTPNGSGTWYVFANRSAGSTAFTLSVSTSPTENANQRRIGRFYFDGDVIVKDSVRTELSEYISSLLYAMHPIQTGGRLTLASGSPISFDISSATSLFYTPHTSNRISLYVPGVGWRLYTFDQLSFSLTGLSANKNYDIFINDDEGELKLSALAWSNDTLRASAYTTQDGIPVMSGASAYRYLGTIRTLSSGGACADCTDKRFVWNMFNRAERILKKTESEASWTYSSAVWRPLNNNSANRVEFVLGITQDPVYLMHSCYVTNSSSGGSCVGVAFDSTNANNADLRCFSDIDLTTISSIFYKVISTGYHFLQLTEWCSAVGTSTFYSYLTTLPSASQWGGLGWLKA